MNMTFRQWVAQFGRPGFRSSPKPLRPKRVKRDKPVWQVCLPGAAPVVVEAYTKGEARAQVKRMLNLDRLPAGVTIRSTAAASAA